MIKELAISLAIGVVSVLFLFGLFYWIFYLIKIIWKYPLFHLKYGMLRKKYDENDVQWCLDAINRGMSEIDVKKHLFLKGTPKKRVDELAYILLHVQKKLKGGMKK